MRLVFRFLAAAVLSLSASVAVAQQLASEPALAKMRWTADETEVPSVPTPPLPFLRPSARGVLSVKTSSAWRVAPNDDQSPEQVTVMLPLSAGLSIVSLPVRTTSDKVSDIFPTLPAGSQVWTWDGSAQRFLAGGGTLSLGEACWIHLPVPTVLVVTGERNLSLEIPVELKRGWNLIGVPFEFPIPRAEQSVYVNHARRGFNEAVAAGAIAPAVWSFDSNGYSFVADDGSFEPLRGYWVYSRELQLLELHPVLLRGGGGFWGGALKAVGSALVSAGVNYGVSTFLFSTGQATDPEMRRRLGEVSGQLDAIIARQKDIQALLEEICDRLQLNTSQVMQAIGDAQYVGPARTFLLTHYDQQTANASLAWFASEAAAGTTISNQQRTEFAKKVVNDWDVVSTFNHINTGIMGATAFSPGLLDSFAEQVIYSSTPGTLKDRYSALEAYFNTLIGYQIKCGTLVMNAYTQLANDPALANNPADPNHHKQDAAANWHRDTFAPVIRQEMERFRTVVERVALAKLALPRDGDDPPVSVPLEVQNMLASLDFMMMNTLNEPGGLRVRVITSPHIDLQPRLYWGKSGTVATRYDLPPLAQWTVLPGKQNYDSWGYSGAYPNGTREFRFTNQWSVMRTRFAADERNTYSIWLDNDGLRAVFGDCPSCRGRALPLTEDLWAETYDVDEDPSTPPQLFASVTFAKRLDAAAMLSPCADDNVTSVGVGKCAGRKPTPGQKPEPCDEVSLYGCEWGTNNVWTAIGVPFKYVGVEEAEGRFWGRATATHPECYPNDDFDVVLSLHAGQTELSQTRKYIEASQTVRHYAPAVRWLPEPTYYFVTKVWWADPMRGPCGWAKLKYLDAVICPGRAEAGEKDCGRRLGD